MLGKEEEGSMEGSSSTSLHFLDLCNLRLGETTPYIGYWFKAYTIFSRPVPHLIGCPPAGFVTESSIDYCFALKAQLLLGYGKTSESCGKWPIPSWPQAKLHGLPLMN